MNVGGVVSCPKPPGNGGIVPPWLRDPFRIILPVEPPVDDEVRLPVLPGGELTRIEAEAVVAHGYALLKAWNDDTHGTL